MSMKLMTHMIAGFPEAGRDEVVAKALIEGGADFLEIQFPFSDPCADGPVIQNACSQALAGGFKLKTGFDLIKKITTLSNIPVFIMTYAAMAVANGVEAFVVKSKAAGARGLIVPDLPPFEDEGLYACCKKNGLNCISVVAPTINKNRLEKILQLGEEYIYVALRTGITGIKTQIDTDTESFLGIIARHPIKILAGFGIQDADQVRTLEGKVYCAIVGSALVKLIDSEKMAANEDLAKAICTRVKNLKGL